MACNSMSVSASPTIKVSIKRSKQTNVKSSFSDNNVCYSANHACVLMNQSQHKYSRLMGTFDSHIPSSSSFHSLFDVETSKETDEEGNELENVENTDMETGKEKKGANWIERLLEIRSKWKTQLDAVEKGCDEGSRRVDNRDDAGGENMSFNRETFSRWLKYVSWFDTKCFSKLAFLSNMAYIIPAIKAKDLRRYYDLEFIMSSLEKKLQKANKAELDQESVSGMAMYTAASTMTAVVMSGEKEKQEEAKSLQSNHNFSPCEWFVCDDKKIYTRHFVIQLNPSHHEVRKMFNLHKFINGLYMAQGLESMASWEAFLLIEPVKFEVALLSSETRFRVPHLTPQLIQQFACLDGIIMMSALMTGTDVLVHRGIYEAAKGLYEQMMPEIMDHVEKHGERAKLQFTGHSIGGSLAVVISLMLLTRMVVKPSTLSPIVTFGSPFLFCDGQKILDELGLDENHIHCVIMHRDIVPRAFSSTLPNYVAEMVKRFSSALKSHAFLNTNKTLYSPMGEVFILQPHEMSSPAHSLLPPGTALYVLEHSKCSTTKSALNAFLNSPHPKEILTDLTAYGSEGTILRDHDSSNYLKALNRVIRESTRKFARKVKKQQSHFWPLLTSEWPHDSSQELTLDDKA